MLRECRVSSSRRRLIFIVPAFLLGTLLCAILSERSAYVHPYLIADNRHYTFYIWKNILGQLGPWRAALAPLYAACLLLVAGSLYNRQGWMWTTGFFLCMAMTLVPAGLLEFRYFTVPALLAAAHWPVPGRACLGVQALHCGIVNATTLHIFMRAPFQWPDGSVARFMW